MGLNCCKGSNETLSEEEIICIQSNAPNATIDVIRYWFKIFIEAYPGDDIPRERIAAIYRAYYTGVNRAHFYQRIVRRYGEESDYALNFRTFMIAAFDVVPPQLNKFDLGFAMFDSNRDGFVNWRDFYRVAKGHFIMAGVEYPGLPAEKVADEIIACLDCDHEDSISMKEFYHRIQDRVLEDPLIYDRLFFVDKISMALIAIANHLSTYP
ncbi:neuronal calcium sensor 2-like [Watersipora subatra]|uniref:neuronal calcium sensor 2-like n=1 Tax=Watersipora subatra TaxID=2589382 RepID=UPI00355BC2F2